MTMAKGSLVYGQSGGPTAVINSSLAGVVQEALSHHEIGDILGMVHGIQGLLNDQFIDLRHQPADVIEGLRKTPSAALGTVRRKLKPDDYQRVLDVLKKRNVRYFLYNGGNDSADTGLQVSKLAAEAGYELNVVAVPKTVDNDLVITDHCPGYGSAARFVALSVRDTSRDTEAMGASAPLKIVEVMGRNAGWLTAAAALARENERDGPHLVYVPECPISEDQLAADVQRVYDELGYCVIALSEGAQSAPGKTLGEELAPQEVDAFGHRPKAGVSEYVTEMLREKIGIRARVDKPNYLQRSFMIAASPVDLDEAYRVGRRAVVEAVNGRRGMVTLIRDAGPEYGASLALADLADIANKEKHLPREMMNAEGNYPTEAFLAYARPLIGPPLPRYVRLERRLV